ncbi:unnamed protein product [Heligmosomoides polygyrus]|uniref:Secreted protein n=1 Tax=Heligmosomoides polygyrus TaxID=6339 RepID=A0A183GJ77_HELPZ|nr:unnamed protein product [Heligmosomoides polygyrus]
MPQLNRRLISPVIGGGAVCRCSFSVSFSRVQSEPLLGGRLCNARRAEDVLCGAVFDWKGAVPGTAAVRGTEQQGRIVRSALLAVRAQFQRLCV